MTDIRFCFKRDGQLVPFDKKRISSAIQKAFAESKEGNRILAQKITESVVDALHRSYPSDPPGVEDIQDTVEEMLMSYNFLKTARAYILYRQKQTEKRTQAV